MYSSASQFFFQKLVLLVDFTFLISDQVAVPQLYICYFLKPFLAPKVN